MNNIEIIITTVAIDILSLGAEIVTKIIRLGFLNDIEIVLKNFFVVFSNILYENKQKLKHLKF